MIDILLEIFTWIGFGAAFLLLVAAVCVWALDGTWISTEAYLEDEPEGRVARWFDGAGQVNRAVLNEEDAHAMAGQDRWQIWYRYGWNDRMRLTRRPPVLRALLLGAAGAAVLGLVCSVISIVMLFIDG